ncbi:MAG: NAD(P)H-dependent oxidoreductase subunit E [Proteobacteria bacterium]|nr:NAD(P)H-dependent oxidoreductase subunit E [Pseudomonadota bacterium]
MALSFSPQAHERIARLLPQYPTRMAACLPVLWVAQEEFGWLSAEAMRLVAETLELPESHVYSVVTFYTMYRRHPVGTYHIQVCTNVACMLRDAYQVLSRFERALELKPGETTPDGTFTLSEVECLAACGTAPCVQINDRYHEPVRPEEVEALVARLRLEAPALRAARPVASAAGPIVTAQSVPAADRAPTAQGLPAVERD